MVRSLVTYVNYYFQVVLNIKRRCLLEESDLFHLLMQVAERHIKGHLLEE